MPPSLPTTHVTSEVPSTKAWLLFLGLLTILLVVGHWVQPPTAGAPAALAGRAAPSVRPAAVPEPRPAATTRRVALENPFWQQPTSGAALVPAATL